MNGILKYIKGRKDIYGENANAHNLLGTYSSLISAIMRSQGREATMIDNAIINAFIGGTDKGTQLLDELASAVKKFCEKLPYRYAVCKFDGCGGSTTSYWHTLDEVIDLVSAETFANNEMFGQLTCYDLVNGEDITAKIYHFIADNRNRYALVGTGGDYSGESDSLPDAILEACDWISNGISEYVEIYDRETGKCVWEGKRGSSSDETDVIIIFEEPKLT